MALESFKPQNGEASAYRASSALSSEVNEVWGRNGSSNRSEQNRPPLGEEDRQGRNGELERSLQVQLNMGLESTGSLYGQTNTLSSTRPDAAPLTDEERREDYAVEAAQQPMDQMGDRNGGNNDEVLAERRGAPVGGTGSPESDLGFGGGEKTVAGVPEPENESIGLQGSPDARLSQAQPQEYVVPESYRAERVGEIYNATAGTTTPADILNGQPGTDRVEQNIHESRISVGNQQLRFPSREDLKSMPIEELNQFVEQNQGALQQFYSQHENDIPLIGFHGAVEPNLSAFINRGESFPGRGGTYFAAVSKLDENPAVAISDLEHSAQFALRYAGGFKASDTPGGIAVFDLSQYADASGGRSLDSNQDVELKDMTNQNALGTEVPQNFSEFATYLLANNFQNAFRGVIPYKAINQYDNLYDDPMASPDSFHRQLLSETLQLQLITTWHWK